MIRRYADNHRLSREAKKKIGTATIGFHLLAALGWLAAGLYGMTVGWQESITFLYWVSVYAVVIAHLAGAIAAWPEPEIIEKLEDLQEAVPEAGGGSADSG